MRTDCDWIDRARTASLNKGQFTVFEKRMRKKYNMLIAVDIQIPLANGSAFLIHLVPDYVLRIKNGNLRRDRMHDILNLRQGLKTIRLCFKTD